MSTSRSVALVDTGVGNLRSVVRALEAASPACRVTVTSDPDAIASSDAIVMPGQGAFGDCARALERDGAALGQSVRSHITRGRPYLGICLGLQVLFEESEEAPGVRGLGVVKGRVVRLHDRPASAEHDAIKVPHVGWNRARWTEHAPRVMGAAGDEPWFYFVHSYVVEPDDDRVVASRTEHGRAFVSAIAHENVIAVQFHPEKSQRAGISLLARWLEAL